MHHPISFVFALALFVLAAPAAAQTTWYVDANCPGPGTGTVGDPFCAIQDAIDAATGGDEVIVEEGTYLESIDFLGKAITVRSTDPLDPLVVAATVIDGGGEFHVVLCTSGERPGTVLDGLTITGGNANGSSPDDSGGGILMLSSSPPRFVDDTGVADTGQAGVGPPEIADMGAYERQDVSGPLTFNLTIADSIQSAIDAAFDGDEIVLGQGTYAQAFVIVDKAITVRSTDPSNPAVVAATIIDATGLNSSVIRLEDTTPATLIEGLTLTGGDPAGFGAEGGGFRIIEGSPTIVGCVVTGNVASGNGGGMHTLNASPTVINCTFSGNSADLRRVLSARHAQPVHPSQRRKRMSSNPSVSRESTPRTSPGGLARSRSSRARSLVGVTAVFAAMAAGVLAGPGDANIQENGEHGFTWEMALGASAWWALPDALPAGIPVQTSGGDVEDDYEFVLLPDVGLPMDINNKRQIVGLDPLMEGGVLVDDGVVTPIVVPGAAFTQPTNINERGDIIGHYRLSLDSPMMGFHRDRHGELTTIVYPDPDAESTFLWGLNQQGDIVGDFRDADFVSTPFILDRHGEFAILDVPGDESAVALGINNRGTISGWFLDEGLSRGYLLEDDGTMVIDYPGAFSSDVGRVNNHGQANGIHFTPPFSISSFLLSPQGEFTDFSFPGMGITLIRGINERGDQCGATSLDFKSPPQAFVAFRVGGGN